MDDKPVTGRRTRWLLAWGIALGLAAAFAGHETVTRTSTDQFCAQACHSHPHAEQFWIQSAHYSNRHGVVAHCTDCHLPPSGLRYLTEKARLGAGDAWAQFFGDPSKIDWERERKLDRAVTFTYDESCLRCHNNLFTQGLSKVEGALPSGEQARDAPQVREMRMVARRMEGHLYYQRNKERMHCINCHLLTGHRMQRKMAARNFAAGEDAQFPLTVEGFRDFTEAVPGSALKFHMIAVQGGTLAVGSPELGSCRLQDAGPTHGVDVKPFWMSQAVVSTRDLELFSLQDASQKQRVTGGLTRRTAVVYTNWLSRVTGKKYRLPTEFELEYACIAGGTMPAWERQVNRAENQDPRMAVLNSWGFFDLPGDRKEWSLDGAEEFEGILSRDTATGVSFRVVREIEENEKTSARHKPWPEESVAQ